MSGGKFCINCVWHCKRFDGFDAWSVCERRLSQRRDPVSGEFADLVGRNCGSERRKDFGLFGGRLRCGPKGRFYEDRR